MITILKAVLTAFVVLLSTACMQTDDEETKTETQEYGVFLSLSGREAIDAAENFEIVVIDAQNLSSEEIAEMQSRGQLVYSYLNVGSLETFRSYYEEFQYLTLKPYVNWENEFWVDASAEEWQYFISVNLATQYVDKGIDGFWVDNVDIYYQYPTEVMYQGVERTLTTLMEYGKPVIINGGDQFVLEYLERKGQVDDILTGVNQETVFSSIDFENRTLGNQNETTQEYYLNYLSMIDQENKNIYLLEYTTDTDLISEIQAFTEEKEWQYYISDSIELDGN